MKYKNIYIIIVIITLFSLKCDSSSDVNNEPINFFDTKEDLTSKKILVDELDFNIPLEMMIKDSLLIVHDQFPIGDDMYLFGAINLQDLTKPITYFGREGRGPNEYSFPSSMSKISGFNDYLAINNRKLFSMSIVSLKKIIEYDILDSLTFINPIDYNFSKIVPVSDSLIIGTGFFEEGRFGLADQEGELIKTVGAYPYPNKYPDLTNQELGMIYQSDLKINPSSNKVAISTYASANLDILEVLPDTVKFLKSLRYFAPNFESTSKNGRLSAQALPNNKSGFIHTAVSSTYIYLLYSGAERSQGLDSYLSGYRVLKYDWDGTPISQYNLDKDVTMISVDEQDRFIIGINRNEESGPILLKYEI